MGVGELNPRIEQIEGNEAIFYFLEILLYGHLYIVSSIFGIGFR